MGGERNSAATSRSLGNTFCQATLAFHAHLSGATCSHPLDIYLLVCSKYYTNDHTIVSLAYILLINCLWAVVCLPWHGSVRVVPSSGYIH